MKNAAAHTATVCLGANSVDKHNAMLGALEAMHSYGTVSRCSGLYEYPAMNGRDADYVNAVVEMITDLPLDDFREACKGLERAAGRTPQSKRIGVIPMDIDVVIWDGEIIRPGEYAMPYFTHGADLLV